MLNAFLKATEHGDLEGLMAVLAPDVVFVGDGGGHFPAARQPVVGSLQVARFVFGLLRLIPPDASEMHTEVVAVNGGLGVLVQARYQGRLFRSVMSFAMDGDRITGVFNQLNPEKVAAGARPDGRRLAATRTGRYVTSASHFWKAVANGSVPSPSAS